MVALLADITREELNNLIDVVTEISKYLMLFIMVIYTLFNFIAIRVKTPKRVRSLCRKQIFMVFLMLVLGYLILFLRTDEISIAIFGIAQMIFFIAYYVVFTMLYPQCSRVIITNTIFLFGFGLLIQARLDYDYAVKQALIGVAGFVLSMFIPAIISHFKKLARFAWLYAIVGIGLLGAVMVLGTTTYGAQLTLSLGPIQLQPSEFVKITFVFFTASMFAQSRSFKQVLITSIVAGAHVLILIASTDLGSGFVYFIGYLFMIYVATHKIRYMFIGLGAGAVAAVGAYSLFSHVKVRVQMWIDPFVDYNNKGYQLAQSLFAISSGGWLGLGLGQGYPNTIPLARNDFVFSAICEEMGIIFSCCLILIYLGFAIQLFRVSTRLRSLFYQIIGVGFAAMIGIQVFMHIGGVTKLIPSTGITLPLISYGGSSVLATMLIIGVIQGLYIKSDGLTAKQRAKLEEQMLDEGGAPYES